MSGHFNLGPKAGPRLRIDTGSSTDAAAPERADDYDALADLFMGELAHGPSPRPETAPTAKRKPVLRLASDEELNDWDEEPAPVATTPLPVPPPAPATGAVVECVVLGHLPVLGAAWAAQYVRQVALTAGKPVAYLRIQSGYASVELVGGSETGAPPESCTTVEDAVKLAAKRTHRWVLRADLGEEPRVAASALVRVITLLTGVDEAAVLGAYSSIKSLATELPAADAERGVTIRVAVMGSTPERADPACKRLAEAVRTFLGREVQHAVCSPKIAASRPSEMLFSGRTELRTSDMMDLLAQVLGVTEAVAPIPAMPESILPPDPAAARTLDELLEGLAPLEPDTTLDEVYTAPEPAREIAPEQRVAAELIAPPRAVRAPEPLAAAKASVASPLIEPTQAAAEATVELPATPTVTERVPEFAVIAVARPTSENEPVGALAHLLSGLRAVSVLCPYAANVELAVDAGGALHLLVRTEPEDGEDSEQRALSQLLVAGSWAEAHAMLLGPAIAQTGAPTAGLSTCKPELHLFTDRPKRSRRLLETDVRIHLLARVEVGGQSGWYCTELN